MRGMIWTSHGMQRTMYIASTGKAVIMRGEDVSSSERESKQNRSTEDENESTRKHTSSTLLARSKPQCTAQPRGRDKLSQARRRVQVRPTPSTQGQRGEIDTS